jgi:nitrate/nitrite-specific signal transduction histidine kinase
LRYADDLRLCFKDNGIGIDPNILETGRAGHFGLQGMKERSARIRAKITISSSRNTGTEVILRVPGEIAYERDDQTLIDRFKALFQSRRAQ